LLLLAGASPAAKDGDVMARALVLLLALALPVVAAPAPFPRVAPPRPLNREGLVGTWTVRWGTVAAVFVLSANGDYVCIWPGARYVGSWGLDRDGRLWITESCRPETSTSWQSYAIRITPETFATSRSTGIFSGPVEVGATGVSVRFEKKP
jgi:hypothetical protein